MIGCDDRQRIGFGAGKFCAKSKSSNTNILRIRNQSEIMFAAEQTFRLANGYSVEGFQLLI